MHSFIQTSLFFLLAYISAATGAHTLDITITGYKTLEGKTFIGVFDTEASYNKGKNAIVSINAKPQGESLRFTIHGLKDGNYAIKAFHDKNHNSKLDKNLLGIPTEQFGFSNKTSSTSPTSYDDAKISVQSDTEISIKF